MSTDHSLIDGRGLNGGANDAYDSRQAKTIEAA
jgi:hypothetical protein